MHALELGGRKWPVSASPFSLYLRFLFSLSCIRSFILLLSLRTDVVENGMAQRRWVRKGLGEESARKDVNVGGRRMIGARGIGSGNPTFGCPEVVFSGNVLCSYVVMILFYSRARCESLYFFAGHAVWQVVCSGLNSPGRVSVFGAGNRWRNELYTSHRDVTEIRWCWCQLQLK